MSVEAPYRRRVVVGRRSSVGRGVSSSRRRLDVSTSRLSTLDWLVVLIMPAHSLLPLSLSVKSFQIGRRPDPTCTVHRTAVERAGPSALNTSDVLNRKTEQHRTPTPHRQTQTTLSQV